MGGSQRGRHPRVPPRLGESPFGKAKWKFLKRSGDGDLLPQGKATLRLTTSPEFHVQGHGLLSTALTNSAPEGQGLESGGRLGWREEAFCFTSEGKQTF